MCNIYHKVANSRDFISSSSSSSRNVFETMFWGNINREEEMSVMVSALTHVVVGQDHRVMNPLQEQTEKIGAADHNDNLFSWGVGEKRRREEEQMQQFLHGNHSSHDMRSSGIFPFLLHFVFEFSLILCCVCIFFPCVERHN